MEKDHYIMVFSTCDSAELATKLAETLVEKKLAACVNIIPGMESVYHWQGKVQRDREILLLIKTRQSCFCNLQQTMKALHNYELPEIIAVPIESGEKHYLDWLRSSTAATEIYNENNNAD